MTVDPEDDEVVTLPAFSHGFAGLLAILHILYVQTDVSPLDVYIPL